MNRWFTLRRGDHMSHATRLTVSIFLVSYFSLVAIPAFSAVQPANHQAVKVDFKEVELPVFIRLVSDVTGKNFIFDEKVTGKVTVITPEAVSVDGLYQLFLSILQFKGYAAVPTDNNLIQIIPLGEAKQNWTEVLSDENGKGFVTRLVSLTYLNANDGMRVLTPLV
jgi:general secretion pathway protein D